MAETDVLALSNYKVSGITDTTVSYHSSEGEFLMNNMYFVTMHEFRSAG